MKRIDAHEQFVSCITWGRQLIGEASGDGGQTINVIATGSSDKVQRLRFFSVQPGNLLPCADSQGMAAIRLEGHVRASGLVFEALCTATFLRQNLSSAFGLLSIVIRLHLSSGLCTLTVQ